MNNDGLPTLLVLLLSGRPQAGRLVCLAKRVLFVGRESGGVNFFGSEVARSQFSPPLSKAPH